jgi:hypothetical protein
MQNLYFLYHRNYKTFHILATIVYSSPLSEGKTSTGFARPTLVPHSTKQGLNKSYNFLKINSHTKFQGGITRGATLVPSTLLL